MSGDLVALQAPPTRVGAWLLRLWGDGDAVLVLDPTAGDAEVGRTLGRLRPARLLTTVPGGDWHEQRLDDPLPTTPDLALVVATSGSTGRPKGVELTHSALGASTAASLRRLGCRNGESWLGCLPTHHVAGLQTLLRSWALGAEPELHDRFDIAAVARSPAPHVSLVPTMLVRLLDAGVDVSRFATILLGGAPPASELLERAADAGAHVVVSYGMSETCGGCVYDHRPLDGVEAAVGADGRIRLRGPMRFAGYRADPTASQAAIDADGWFVTSDVGRFDGRHLEVLGRADDVVISGGENVPLEAVAATLRSHPEVIDAVAAGRPDPEWGQVVVAVIVPADTDRPPAPDALQAHVCTWHPPAFAPREVVTAPAIPRDGLGKVTRATLDGLLAAH